MSNNGMMAVFSASRSVVDLAIDPLITCKLCLAECTAGYVRTTRLQMYILFTSKYSLSYSGDGNFVWTRKSLF